MWVLCACPKMTDLSVQREGLQHCTYASWVNSTSKKVGRGEGGMKLFQEKPSNSPRSKKNAVLQHPKTGCARHEEVQKKSGPKFSEAHLASKIQRVI